MQRNISSLILAALVWTLGGCVSSSSTISTNADGPHEVRGTWITTTANSAVATPEATTATMKRLADIGLNTVYVEVWKNGDTRFPSAVLKRIIGVERDTSTASASPPRDLLQEMLIEGHRNGLITVAWFEYGFMVAHKSTDPLLRRMKPEWLSRDIKGNEVAPNGFVWMNPLHPEARQFLLDLVLEAIDKYDLDGVQLDDRIVWPYVTMGYDATTRKVYATEHGGREPPADHTDPAWMRWRAEKVNAFAKRFVEEIRAKRPRLLVSLSPAVYPWSWEHYLLEWPQWASWKAGDGSRAGTAPRWDEFIPQVYRQDYPAFENTWLQQVQHMKTLGNDRQRDMLAGIRIVGEGANATWDALRQSIELTRKTGSGGHVLWFSRGVLDVYPRELKTFYAGPTASPQFPAGWRQKSIALFRDAIAPRSGDTAWSHPDIPRGRYRLIGRDGSRWEYVSDHSIQSGNAGIGKTVFLVDSRYREVELIVDRR